MAAEALWEARLTHGWVEVDGEDQWAAQWGTGWQPASPEGQAKFRPGVTCIVSKGEGALHPRRHLG